MSSDAHSKCDCDWTKRTDSASITCAKKTGSPRTAHVQMGVLKLHATNCNYLKLKDFPPTPASGVWVPPSRCS